MTSWLDNPLRTLSDVERFESEMPLEGRLPGDSVYDVFEHAARADADRVALTMVMTGDADEQPRQRGGTQPLRGSTT